MTHNNNTLIEYATQVNNRCPKLQVYRSLCFCAFRGGGLFVVVHAFTLPRSSPPRDAFVAHGMLGVPRIFLLVPERRLPRVRLRSVCPRWPTYSACVDLLLLLLRPTGVGIGGDFPWLCFELVLLVTRGCAFEDKASTESFKISFFCVDVSNCSTALPSTLPQPFLQYPTPGIGTPGVYRPIARFLGRRLERFHKANPLARPGFVHAADAESSGIPGSAPATHVSFGSDCKYPARCSTEYLGLGR